MRAGSPALILTKIAHRLARGAKSVAFGPIPPHPSPTMSETSSIYDRIGGEPGIERLVDSFYERVLADAELKSYFEHAPMDKLRSMQREFFAAAAGGPIAYTGRPLRQVHRPLAISRREFQRFTEHLIETLETFEGISRQDILDVIARVNLYADEITNDTNVDG
jgi:hemoglobin